MNKWLQYGKVDKQCSGATMMHSKGHALSY